MRRITAAPRLAPLNSGEILPGAAATSDSDLRACVRGQGQRIYHPVGSCKKWAPIPMAVVDASLRVRGLADLRPR